MFSQKATVLRFLQGYFVVTQHKLKFIT